MGRVIIDRTRKGREGDYEESTCFGVPVVSHPDVPPGMMFLMDAEDEWVYTQEKIEPKDVEALNRLMAIKNVCDPDCPYHGGKDERN